MHRIIS